MPSTPPSSAARRRKLGPALGVALVLSPAVLLVPPGRGDGALAAPRAATTTALEGGRTRHDVELVATRVELAHLGMHTHANWVSFELPFEAGDPKVRDVRLTFRTLVPSEVSALRLGPLCVRAPTLGGVADPRWTKLTRTGGAGTQPPWEWEGELPPLGPRTLLVSVPTRVANASACWLPGLAIREAWRLDLSWETR